MNAAAGAQSSGYVEHRTQAGQAVSFDDDPLGALPSSAVGALLGGFHSAKRFDLMRPRATFVPELLKAVEKM